MTILFISQVKLQLCYYTYQSGILLTLEPGSRTILGIDDILTAPRVPDDLLLSECDFPSSVDFTHDRFPIST